MLYFLETIKPGIKSKNNEHDSDELENLSKKLKINHINIESNVVEKSNQEVDSNKESNSSLPSLSSFEILVNFFQNILNDKSRLYETSASDRQLFKYKLRKMEALYSVTDEERLRIKEMFFEKLPDLVLFVLLESPSFLLNDRLVSLKDHAVENKSASNKDSKKNKQIAISKQLVPQNKQNYKICYPNDKRQILVELAF